MALKFENDIVIVNDGRHYHTAINAGSHVIIADEPADHDGKDEGPTPHQYFLGALGSCTAITLRMYIDRKQWKVDEIKIALNMEKVSDGNSEKTIIYRKLFFKGELDNAQIERLNIIADKCPVHKTITGDVTIINKEEQ